MSRRPPLPRDEEEARYQNKIRHLQAVRRAAEQKKLARGDGSPPSGLLHRILRFVLGRED